MKKMFYILFLSVGIANAQIVNIPDANFKTKLLSATSTNNVALNSSGLSTKIDANDDGEIQESEALVIVNLDLEDSNISNMIGVEAFLNLTNLSFQKNLVTNIDFINNLINLNWFDGSQNQIQAVHFTTNNGFVFFDVSNNLVSSVTSTETIFIGESLMDNNLITDLDLSKIKLSGNLHTYYDNPIVSINLKNDYIEDVTILATMNSPALQFVCVDEGQGIEITQYLIDLGLPNVVVNSYCSFTPGGSYNTIIGTVTYDLNSNGCDVNNQPMPNIRMGINDGTNQGATFTNASGVFNFYTDAGSFTINPNIENPTWFTVSPTSATIPFADNNNNVATQNFCISAVGAHADVEVVIAPIIPARPGFDAVYQIVYKNKGNQTISGDVSFTYDDSVVDFVSATITPTTQNTNVLNWLYSDLLPFENRSIYVTLNVNSPTDTPAVNIDDVLVFDAGITSSITDEFVDDNSFIYNQTVVGSFDPNDIVCIEGDSLPVSEIGEYLHYVINFENTGNSEAENIVVRAEIDATEFDVNSLQMLNTSHDAYIRQNANVVEFVFQNIAVESGGHGNVLIKIKTKDNLLNGATVAKQAAIYFDYNAPIETNMANTTFQLLSSGDFEVDNSILVYPNPTKSIINVNCNTNIKTVQLYDIQGRLLQTHIVNDANTLIDVSDKSSGIYFAKITSDVGVKVEKIIKE